MADDRMAALELLRKAAGHGDLDFNARAASGERPIASPRAVRAGRPPRPGAPRRADRVPPSRQGRMSMKMFFVSV